jgi:hypothetical protein
MKSVEVNINNPKTDNDNPPAYRIIVRKAKTINLQVLQTWLQKKGSFDERVLEALNFMDHLLREFPSTKYTPIRRAFFDPKEESRNFDSTLDLQKGFYQAIRPAFVSDHRFSVSMHNYLTNNQGRKTRCECRQRSLRILAAGDACQSCRRIPSKLRLEQNCSGTEAQERQSSKPFSGIYLQQGS